jgi:AraC-like DNA-binding protein
MQQRLRDARQAYEDGIETREQTMVAAHDAGASLGEISREVGMSVTGVMRLLQRHGRDTSERFPPQFDK